MGPKIAAWGASVGALVVVLYPGDLGVALQSVIVASCGLIVAVHIGGVHAHRAAQHGATARVAAAKVHAAGASAPMDAALSALGLQSPPSRATVAGGSSDGAPGAPPTAA